MSKRLGEQAELDGEKHERSYIEEPADLEVTGICKDRHSPEWPN